MVSIVRFVLFLISYGLCVLAISNCIMYLNYRTLGYTWQAVFYFLLQTAEFYMGIIGLIILFGVAYDLFPSRS